jgi:hypothetical protein
VGRELCVEPRRGLGQSGQRNPMMLVSRITKPITGSNVDRRNHSINAVRSVRGVEFLRRCEEIRVVDLLHSCPWDHSGRFQIVSMSMTICGRIGGCVRPSSLGGPAGFASLFHCRPCFTGVASLVGWVFSSWCQDRIACAQSQRGVPASPRTSFVGSTSRILQPFPLQPLGRQTRAAKE